MASPDHGVARFVRDVLGCGCPDDVLRDIRIDRHHWIAGIDAPLARIDVGGRLLVWVIAVGDRPTHLAALVAGGVLAGLHERDRLAFNRLRLVLATPAPSEIDALARQSFNACRVPDDRIHLHVVDLRSVPPSARPIEANRQS